jgi:uncharacterized protein (DUF433 family)
VVAAIAEIERGTELGQGLFSLGDLRGYMALSGVREDADRVLPWLGNVLNPVQHTAKRPDYSFGDLVSLFVVRELLKKGLRPVVIHDAEIYLRKKWRTARPFVSDEIKTDGCGIFVDDELVAGDQLESADKHGQQVMREAVRERLATVRYAEGIAASWQPSTDVEVDPTIQFGEPVVARTRIPTAAISDMSEWASPERIASDLQISTRLVEAALSFQHRLATSLN